jgi:polar amino acid transport system ATP-binding protein
MASGALLECRGLKKRFGSTEVLRGVDLSVGEGERLCIIGPSGGGKTTLLRCFALLESLEPGVVLFCGQMVGYQVKGRKLHRWGESEAAAYRSQIGMVFQHFNLFPNMTAAQNVAFGRRRVRHESRKQAMAVAREELARVGLGHKLDAYPIDLSGGQQQRVAIARSLAMEPKLILFDEPTSALDPELVGEVLGAMKQLASDGMTMIVVTHEIEFAREVGDTVVFMEGGVVVESGPPAEVLVAPKSERAKEFLRAVLSEPEAARADDPLGDSAGR